MPIDDDVEVSTPSATDAPASDGTEHHDSSAIVQHDKETTRRTIGETLRAAVEEHKREPSPARQAAARDRTREPDTKRFAPESDKANTANTANTADSSVERPVKAAPATPSPAVKPAEQQPATSTPATGVPSSWSKEAKDAWASIPPAVQQAVAKREEEAARGFAQYQARTRDIDQAFTPQRRAALQQFGKTEGQAIDQLFGWHEALSDPRRQHDAFRALAQSHGFDLATLIGPPQSQQQAADPNDPRALLQGYVNPMLTPLQQEQQRQAMELQQLRAWREQETTGRIHADIASFSKDKPHFERVRVTMGQLIHSGAATSLEDAYQKAVWADPDIRNELLAEENAKREANSKAAQEAAQAKNAADAEAKRKADAEAAAKARRANVSVRGSTPVAGLAPRQGKKSIRESITAAINEGRASV